MSLTDIRMIENKLVGRKEVSGKIAYDKPVKRDEVRQLLAEHFKTDVNNIVIRKMSYLTGTRLIDVKAHIYDSLDSIKAFEPLHILIRNNLAEKPKK
ncbi:MAG: hypothetical protein QXF45_00885 [Candidatus Caldarchaeum sp.]